MKLPNIIKIDKAKSKLFVYKRIILLLLKFHTILYGLITRLSVLAEPNNLHPKHRLMLYHQWFVSQCKSEWRVLDVGCGNGALSADLAKLCKTVVGIDISSDNIKQARQRAEGEFICADATTYIFGSKFDAVILSNVLEHIQDRVDFLGKLSKNSDLFLILVPMIDRDWVTLYKKEMGIEYRLDQTHFVEYTFESFIEEMKAAGLDVESFRICFGELYAVVRKK